MPNLKTVFLSLVIALLVMAGSAYAVPAGVTPSNCPSTVEGCNPPINVSSVSQIKNGGLGLGGSLGLSSGSFIDFNSTVAGRLPTATEGKISYEADKLNVYGAGIEPERKVVIYDKLCDSTGVCKSTSDIVAGGQGGGVSSGGLYGYVKFIDNLPRVNDNLNPKNYTVDGTTVSGVDIGTLSGANAFISTACAQVEYKYPVFCVRKPNTYLTHSILYCASGFTMLPSFVCYKN